MSRRMHFWLCLAGLALIALALAFPSIVQAGGWVVVTLDQVPANVVAGEPYLLGLTARQHGVTPWDIEQITLRASHVETRQTLTFAALPSEPKGHYEAELLFPKSGAWTLGAESGMHPPLQPLMDVQVAEKSGAAAAQNRAPIAPSPSAPGLPVYALGLVSLAGLGALILLVVRGRVKPVITWALLVALVLGAGLAFALLSNARAGSSTVAGAAAADAEAEAVPNTGSDLAATGKQVFLAKGCVVCHTNNRAIEQSEQYGVNIGPNLTSYEGDPVAMRNFLLSPQAAKPGATMPTLGLKPEEIEALIAFLNQ